MELKCGIGAKTQGLGISYDLGENLLLLFC